MSSISDSSEPGVFSTPLAPWFELPRDPSQREALTQLVTDDAPPPTKITSLHHHLGLTSTSSQLDQWESLTLVASIDVAGARMLEPHIDALGIIAEAGLKAPADHSSWGVYAAEVPGKVVTVAEANGSTVITGEKAWCSLASELSHAIVICHDNGRGQAMAVSLTDPRVHPDRAAWPSIGLHEIPSGSVTFDQAPAEVVGPPGWYLDRPSFAWGGIRVAACWFGGALGLAQNAARRHFARPGPAPMGDLNMGRLDAEIFATRAVLAQAAEAADGDTQFSRDEAWSLALRVRNIVYRSAQRIQLLCRELAGPAALTGDRAFAKADADLTVYLSQHHGPRDEASLGEELAKETPQR